MLLAGIQAETGLDPRLKHSRVTVLESHLSAPAENSKKRRWNVLPNQVSTLSIYFPRLCSPQALKRRRTR